MPLPTGLLGVVHLPALPGDPGHDGKSRFSDALDFALADAHALVEGGVDALIIENFGSAPFGKGTPGERIAPHEVAFLACVAAACRARFDIKLGVNCLRNDAPAAIGIAAATGLDFIRVNVHTGAYVTDQGIIEGEAHRTLRYRRALGADEVAILADILVKHAAPLVASDPEQLVGDTLLRGRADAVIVTGQATGRPVDATFLERVSRAAGSAPVFIGSGLNPDNAAALAPLAHGAIVGTFFKRDGQIHQPVDIARVRQLARLLKGRFKSVNQ
ncbi:MAG: BtpA/SgcQ family protein [Bradymonadaceae bacterium]|nr:BtpA/SgcQ family protein [Lujinxingiaceae bacterium]